MTQPPVAGSAVEPLTLSPQEALEVIETLVTYLEIWDHSQPFAYLLHASVNEKLYTRCIIVCQNAYSAVRQRRPHPLPRFDTLSQNEGPMVQAVVHEAIAYLAAQVRASLPK